MLMKQKYYVFRNIVRNIVAYNRSMDKLVNSELMVNIHFNNVNADKVTHLYLYYRLRMVAADYGGSFSSYAMSKNERYVQLPELVRLGWVTQDLKIVKYRRICNNSKAVGKWLRMPSEMLESLAAFKGFIIASAEAYILNRNKKIQDGRSKVYSPRTGSYVRRDWVDRRGSKTLSKVMKISSGGIESVEGRVYLNSLAGLLGLSNRTLSRWRKDSVNTYTKVFVKNFEGRDISMHFYSKSVGGYFSVDHKTRSDIQVFNNKYYSGLDYV